MWGNNANLTLGQPDTKSRENPELVESLWSQKSNVKQVTGLFLSRSIKLFSLFLHVSMGVLDREFQTYQILKTLDFVETKTHFPIKHNVLQNSWLDSLHKFL